MRSDGSTGALLDAVVKPVGSRESRTWTRHLPTLGLTGLTLLLLATYAILWSGGRLQGGDNSSSVTGAKRGGAHAVPPNRTENGSSVAANASNNSVVSSPSGGTADALASPPADAGVQLTWEPAPKQTWQRKCVMPPEQPKLGQRKCYYQEGLLHSLISTRPKHNASRYHPELTYWEAYVDGAGLKAHLSASNLTVQQPGAMRGDCLFAVLRRPEPFHESMLYRNRPIPEDLPGGAPFAFWRWDSKVITRAEFDAVPGPGKSLAQNVGYCSRCNTLYYYKVRWCSWFRASACP
jgi:hypothetical protein